ncbi:Uncharacterised protein [Enterobacter cloacae]|nr:Uncharacterised protein [Enterobacter cloacae]
MRATVQQIFTLKIQRSFSAFGQVAALCQRRRTTGVVFQRGHQDLWDIHPTELTKIRVK